MALIVAGMVVGFGLDFPNYLGERPAPPLILHLHAAVYVAWLGLVLAQIALVETGRTRLHRTLGWATAVVAVVMIPLGLTAAFVGEARAVHQPDYDPQFLALEFEEMIGFAIFTVAGLVWRNDPAAHKRLMLLSGVAISDAGFARTWLLGIKLRLPGMFGWWLQYFWGIALILMAMAAWDLWRRRRVHPSIIAGALVLISGEVAVTVLYFSPAWKALMTTAVKAWGWTG